MNPKYCSSSIGHRRLVSEGNTFLLSRLKKKINFTPKIYVYVSKTVFVFILNIRELAGWIGQ